MFEFVLNNQTVFLIAIIITIALSLMMLGFTILHEKSFAMYALLFGNVSFSLHFVFTYYNATQGDMRYAIIVAAFELSGFALWMLSLKAIINIPLHISRILVVLSLGIIITALLFISGASTALRRSITTLFMVLLLLDGLISITIYNRLSMLKSYYYTSISLSLFILFKTGKAIYRIIQPLHITNVFEANNSIGYFNILSLLFAVLINFAFLYLDHDYLRNELKEAGYIDFLTKLHNRRYFIEQVETLPSLSNMIYAIVILDLDYFKSVNDTYGHTIGDMVLADFSDYLTSSTRKQDLVARYGGEEFILLLKVNNQSDLVQFMTRLQEGLASLSLTEQSLTIAYSAGAITFKKIDNNIDTIINYADESLYAAKENGRNQTVYHPNSLN